jgi:lipoyl(octanoyl) transferase
VKVTGQRISSGERVLRAYLFGLMDFEAAMHLQRRFVEQVQERRDAAFLLLCEHPPQISIGREGSWAHIQSDGHALNPGGLPVRWVNRGGGCFHHQPGQLALYFMTALDRHGLTIPAYLDRLSLVLADVLGDFCLRPDAGADSADLHVAGRTIANVGVAVSNWVTYFGAVLNINPDLSAWRRGGGWHFSGMTSIERERRGPLRTAMLRERLLDHLAARFGFTRTSLFLDHPSLRRKVTLHALPATP